jgi:hypothetical protein
MVSQWRCWRRHVKESFLQSSVVVRLASDSQNSSAGFFAVIGFQLSASYRLSAAETLLSGLCRGSKNSGEAGCYRLLFALSSADLRTIPTRVHAILRTADYHINAKRASNSRKRGA